VRLPLVKSSVLIGAADTTDGIATTTAMVATNENPSTADPSFRNISPALPPRPSTAESEQQALYVWSENMSIALAFLNEKRKSRCSTTHARWACGPPERQ
jgi:hypothetical protein